LNLSRSLHAESLSIARNIVEMIRKWLAALFIVIALVIATVAFTLPRLRNSNATAAGDEQQLKELLRQWDEAYARRDGPALNNILADEFVFTAPNGLVINRMQYLSANLKAPDIAVETPVTSEDVRVRVYGSTAVVTSTAAQRGQRFNRDPNVRFRYTDLWVKRNRRWQAVASQSTQVATR
jgi:ketosteroid isomerase-like protein